VDALRLGRVVPLAAALAQRSGRPGLRRITPDPAVSDRYQLDWLIQ